MNVVRDRRNNVFTHIEVRVGERERDAIFIYFGIVS